MNPFVQIAVVAACMVIVIVAIYRKVPISLRGGPVHLDLSLTESIKEIKSEVEKINKAVNNTPTDTPPLVRRVEQVEAISYWTADALHRIARHVGLTIPDPPDRRQHPKESTHDE